MPSSFDTVLEAPSGKSGVCVIDGALCEPAYLPESTSTVDSSDVLIARLAYQSGMCYTDVRATFDIPLTSAGTDFQLHVWQAISATPCGSVITYDTIAQQVSNVLHAVG